MATGTFTYNALRTKTLKGRIKTKRKIVSQGLDKSNAVSVGMTAIKPYLSICLVSLVWFARYSGKMYSCHLFSYGGLSHSHSHSHSNFSWAFLSKGERCMRLTLCEEPTRETRSDHNTGNFIPYSFR